jgi:hypothetical protein
MEPVSYAIVSNRCPFRIHRGEDNVQTPNHINQGNLCLNTGWSAVGRYCANQSVERTDECAQRRLCGVVSFGWNYEDCRLLGVGLRKNERKSGELIGV